MVAVAVMALPSQARATNVIAGVCTLNVDLTTAPVTTTADHANLGVVTTDGTCRVPTIELDPSTATLSGTLFPPVDTETPNYACVSGVWTGVLDLDIGDLTFSGKTVLWTGAVLGAVAIVAVPGLNYAAAGVLIRDTADATNAAACVLGAEATTSWTVVLVFEDPELT